MDLEALEAENDRGIAALGERVGALRGVTSGIHGEVESQHRILDNMVSCLGKGAASLARKSPHLECRTVCEGALHRMA